MEKFHASRGPSKNTQLNRYSYWSCKCVASHTINKKTTAQQTDYKKHAQNGDTYFNKSVDYHLDRNKTLKLPILYMSYFKLICYLQLLHWQAAGIHMA